MNRHELGTRNRTLAEKRLRARGPRGPLPFLTSSPRRTPAYRHPRRLLVLCPGDAAHALFSTPALVALRAAYPQAHITAGVGLAAESILSNNPEINDLRLIRALDVPEEDASSQQLGDWPDTLDTEGYDAALVMAPSHWVAALLTARARIPRRLGIDDGQGAGGYLTDASPRQPEAHAVTHNLRLVEALVGAPPTVPTHLRLYLTDTLVALAYRSALADLAGDPRPVVAIDPGDGLHPADWRPEAWALVSDQLILQREVNVVLFGDEAGAAQRETIARSMRFQPTLLRGNLEPLFAAALFAKAALVMGGYHGLLHMAVALQRPSLFLYGPHDPAEVGPWGDAQRHRVLHSLMPCAGCRLPDWPQDSLDNHPCVRDLDSYTVLDNALELLALNPAPAALGQRAVTG